MPNTIMTVTGEISLNSLGITLMHEHLYANNSGWWHCPSCKDRMHLANSNVNMSILGELRKDPFVNKDNIVLNDLEAVTNELLDLSSKLKQSFVKDNIGNAFNDCLLYTSPRPRD